MARPVSPKAVPAFERLPASRRFQRKCGDVIAPWIEDSDSTVLQILRVARNQIEVGLDRRRRKQGIDDGRRMTRFSFHTPEMAPQRRTMGSLSDKIRAAKRASSASRVAM
jgi:hypothetical protein